MNSTTRNILNIAGVILGIWIALKIVSFVTVLLFKIAIPVLILGGIGYAIYRTNGGRALMGGRKTLP
jgi:hypothetical protein